MKPNTYITIGIIASLAAIISKILFKETPEIIKGGAILFDQVLFPLSLAFLASCIFYFISIYIPRKKDQSNIQGYISYLIKEVIGHGRIVFKILMETSGFQGDIDSLTIQDFKSICPRIKLANSPPPHYKVMRYFAFYLTSYADYLRFYKESSIRDINKIFTYIIFLDSDLIKRLNTVLNCEYFFMCDEVLVPNFLVLFPDADLTSFEDALAHYYSAVKDLESYYKIKFESKFSA
jgi:hypothetical protein